MWMHQFDEYNDTKARNRLSLLDRVRAIRAYEKTPIYQKVGHMFNCSGKQIRNIIRNKDKIMALYKVTENHITNSTGSSENDRRRARKINLLGKVMHEWFLRARRNPQIGAITYKLLQTVALEVKQHLRVENFQPNNAWLINFRHSYNVSDIDMKASLAGEPGPTSLEIGEIVEYVQQKERQDSTYWLETVPGWNDDSVASSTLYISNSAPTSCSRDSPQSIGIERNGEAANDAKDDENDGQPLSKLPKLEPIDVIEVESDDDDNDNGKSTNGHGKTSKSQALRSVNQALQHLKPLEDFALMMEDYRAIGLISQLEIILKQNQK